MDINKLIEQAIQEKMKSTEILKHVRGTVVSFDEDYISVLVDIYGKQVTVINKSGCELAEGDEVTIYYWTNVSNGYIAFVNNRTAPKQGGFNIQNAVVMTENQADTYTYADEIINVDVKNSIQVKYGNGQNVFFANGQAIVASSLKETRDDYNPDGSLTTDYVDFANRIYTNSPELISASCEVLEYTTDTKTVIYKTDIGGGVTKDSSGNDIWYWKPYITKIDKTTKDILGSESNYGILNSTSQLIDGVNNVGVIGMIFISSQIKPPDTNNAYGYAVCKILPIVYGSDIKDSANNVHIGVPMNDFVTHLMTTYNFAFKNQAEYDYAVTTLSKSEINPSS